MSKTRYTYVCIYQSSSEYGGPEEGGWSYTNHELVWKQRVPERQALKRLEEVRQELERSKATKERRWRWELLAWVSSEPKRFICGRPVGGWDGDYSEPEHKDGERCWFCYLPPDLDGVVCKEHQPFQFQALMNRYNSKRSDVLWARQRVARYQRDHRLDGTEYTVEEKVRFIVNSKRGLKSLPF